MRLRYFLSFIIVILLAPVMGRGEIAGFEFGGITPVGDFSLSNRIGKTAGSKDHIINIEDCKQYQGHEIEIHWSLNRTPASGTKWAVKMSQPGGSCSTTDMSELGSNCYKEFLVSEKDLTTPVNNSFYVPLDALMGGDCNANTDKVTNVYVLLNENNAVSAETIAFEVDLQPPKPPSITKVTEGDRNLTVEWEDDENAGEEGLTYRVYWCPQKFSNSNKKACKYSDKLTALSYQITGLENGKTYYVGVTAIDKNENEGLLSELVKGTPVEVRDFFEYYKQQGGREAGDYCFIATAAYGTKDMPDVRVLRHFRDVFLLTNPAGRAFVRFYYKNSPPIAHFIAGHPVLKWIVRITLKPFVWLAKLALYNKYLGLIGFMLLFFALVWVPVKLVRRFV